ncbi:hypothetical protein [Neptunicella sp. SCSIO 80796]
MREISKLSQHVSEFDQKMAIWEAIDDDATYLNILKGYSPLPEEIK